jgi:branched-chain amino acid transport system substrate-binding protein
MNSGTTIPAAKIYHQCGIPHITPFATNPELTRLGYHTTFRMGPNDNVLGGAVAAFAAERLKIKTVVVVDDRTAYGQGVAAEFKKTAQAKGVRVVAEHYTDDKATDFTAILTAIKAQAPDGMFYGGVYPQAGGMLRQMEQLGLLNVKFLGGDGMCNPKLAELAGGAKTIENVFCTVGFRPAELTGAAAGTTWRKRYEDRFPGQTLFTAPASYDATMVLVDAMVRAGSAEPAAYLPQLMTVNYNGLTSRIAFNSDGEMKDPPSTLYGFKGGQRTTLD